MGGWSHLKAAADDDVMHCRSLPLCSGTTVCLQRSPARHWEQHRLSSRLPVWRQPLRKLALAASQQVWRRLLDQQAAPHVHGSHSDPGRQPRLCRRCVESRPMLTLQCVSQTNPGGHRTPCVGGTWLRLPSSSARSIWSQASQSL